MYVNVISNDHGWYDFISAHRRKDPKPPQKNARFWPYLAKCRGFMMEGCHRTPPNLGTSSRGTLESVPPRP